MLHQIKDPSESTYDHSKLFFFLAIVIAIYKVPLKIYRYT